MNPINSSNPTLKKLAVIQPDDFKYYSRPLTSKLLESMNLDKNYFHGEGDYLFYEDQHRIHRVLDLTGGYGANLLGHRHPLILAKIEAWADNGTPNLTQGSVREKSGKLARKISETLQLETSEGPWITTFSNSGTEAVEAALKHCLIYHQQKLTKLLQEINKEMNTALVFLKRSEPKMMEKNFKRLKAELLGKMDDLKVPVERRSYLIHQVSQSRDINDLVSIIREMNQKQAGQKPQFITLEKSYHGKTMGALSLTSNEGFRSPFFLSDEFNNNIFISQYIDQLKLEETISNTQQDLVFLGLTPQGVTWAKHPFSMIAGAFVEPIQGEAGIIPVSAGFIALLKKYSLQEDFLLVFDEIQAGMYRTGTFSSGTHSDITADIYIFSKSLGGGVAKIGATSILSRKYVEDFGYLHSSTFSDDDFSSEIALQVLEILQGENSPLEEGMKNAHYLSARLEWLKNKYPQAVKEYRGRGLMLAIEFKDVFSEMGFEFKTACDAKMQGYIMASALLNHEGLRMSPSLSNNLTLRIQPSLYIDLIQIEELISGLVNLCEAMEQRNIAYFLSALYPNQIIHNEKTPDLQVNIEKSDRPMTVFLCHLIDGGHIKKVTQSLKDMDNAELLRKLALTKDIAEFEIYHAQTITDKNGQEMDIVMMGIPVTSEELKKTFLSRNKHQVVQKVQNAIDFAKSLGATTVGLGQFTSIVSGNGLYLNSHGMNLTTGNAYTVALAVKSALRSAQDKHVDLSLSTVALIGAAGNIMSVATSLMGDHVGKIITIHHSPLAASLKFQQSTRRILNEIASSQSASPVVQVIKKLWKNDKDLLGFLAQDEVKNVFSASSEITDISEAQIVMCGASASNGFLNLELFKKDAVIVDVAVPPSIKPELLAAIDENRPDLTYHLGGVAQIPDKQNIDFFVFPLGENECYACMAETFSIGFSNQKNFLNIGDLDKTVVMEVDKLAQNAGFILGSNKDKSSL